LEFVGIVEIVGIVGICWTEVVRLVEIVGICWTEVGIFYKIKKSAVKRRYLTSSAYTSWQRKYPTGSYRLENQNIRSIVPKTADDGQCLKEYREGAVILMRETHTSNAYIRKILQMELQGTRRGNSKQTVYLDP
jgi:hypothetical protein